MANDTRTTVDLRSSCEKGRHGWCSPRVCAEARAILREERRLARLEKEGR